MEMPFGGLGLVQALGLGVWGVGFTLLSGAIV